MTRSTRARSLALALALAVGGAVTVTACSDDTTDASPTTTTETAEDLAARWVEEANAICYRTDARADAVYEELGEDPDPAAFLAAYRADLLPLIQAQIDDIAALDAPPAQEAEIEAFLDSARTAVDEAAALDVAAFEAGEDPFTTASIRARKLGLACGGDDG